MAGDPGGQRAVGARAGLRPPEDDLPPEEGPPRPPPDGPPRAPPPSPRDRGGRPPDEQFGPPIDPATPGTWVWAYGADRRSRNAMAPAFPETLAKRLDGGYTMFGKCGPESVITALADSDVQGDRATSPPKVQKVTIKRAK